LLRALWTCCLEKNLSIILQLTFHFSIFVVSSLLHPAYLIQPQQITCIKWKGCTMRMFLCFRLLSTYIAFTESFWWLVGNTLYGKLQGAPVAVNFVVTIYNSKLTRDAMSAVKSETYCSCIFQRESCLCYYVYVILVDIANLLSSSTALSLRFTIWGAFKRVYETKSKISYNSFVRHSFVDTIHINVFMFNTMQKSHKCHFIFHFPLFT